MPYFGRILDSRAMGSLARLLCAEVLQSIAAIPEKAVIHANAHGRGIRRSRQKPGLALSTGLYDWDAPESARYLFPGIATVLEGALQVWMNQTAFTARQGDWLIFPCDVPHQEFCLPSRRSYRVAWFQFPAGEFHLAVSRYAKTDGFHIDAYCALEKPSEQSLSEAEEILRDPAQPPEALQRRLVHLVSWWLRALDAETGHAVLHLHPLIERINALIQNLETRSLSVTSLAHQLGLSLNYISTIYRRHTGKTLQKTIQEKRIERARFYLSATAMPIKEIALRLGYADAQHFNHAFRRAEKTSPSRFRREANSLI